MNLEMLATHASFWDSAQPGIRMVSVYFGEPPIRREVIEVKSVESAQNAFNRFVEDSKATGLPFSARARQLRGSRAVAGWKNTRLAYDWEPIATPESR